VLGIVSALAFGSGCTTSRAAERVAKGGAAAPVAIAQAKAEDVPIEVSAFGTVEASSTVGIVPQVSGLITAVHFQEGSFVKQGDLLFTVDTRPYKASLAVARADLAKNEARAQQASREAERYLELERQGLASEQQSAQMQSQAVSARAEAKAVEAQLQSASLNVNFTRITSPIDGRTGSLLVHAGNVIQANAPAPLVVIRRLSPVFVRFALPQTYLPQIQQSLGQRALPARATPRGEGARAALGELSFMDNTVDTATGSVALKATFANRGLELWPGAAVAVTLVLGNEANALVVPAAAVRDSQNGTYVFVVQGDVAVLRPVQVERSTADIAVLKSGVQLGESVVTDGQVRLRDGVKVAIQPGRAPSRDSPAETPAGSGSP
jgi:multidrug efflux system membrane fusion protein